MKMRALLVAFALRCWPQAPEALIWLLLSGFTW
jgi:hypothetical protein